MIRVRVKEVLDSQVTPAYGFALSAEDAISKLIDAAAPVEWREDDPPFDEICNTAQSYMFKLWKGQIIYTLEYEQLRPVWSPTSPQVYKFSAHRCASLVRQFGLDVLPFTPERAVFECDMCDSCWSIQPEDERGFPDF